MVNRLIGIDPSFKTTGLAVHDFATDTWHFYTGDIFDCMAWLNQTQALKNAAVVLENPNLDATFFGGWSAIKSKLYLFKTGKVSLADLESEFRMSAKMAMNAGTSKAAGDHWLKILQRAGVPVYQVKPSDRNRYDKAKHAGREKLLVMPTKLDAEAFTRLTGLNERNSEHARDAATLIWGRNSKWAEMMTGGK